MNTKISITKNGNVAPNKPIDLGFKYESVGDTIEFNIPEEYKSLNHYLLFKNNTKKTKFMLPIENLKFTITTSVTKNAGEYELIFVASDGESINFLSAPIPGVVKDNFITQQTLDEGTDENLVILYDRLLKAIEKAENLMANDKYYIPSYSNNQLIFTGSAKDMPIIEPINMEFINISEEQVNSIFEEVYGR